MKRKSKPIILELETPDYKIRYDIGKIISKHQNLKLAGIRKKEIVEIKPAFFEINDHWYTEFGVAKPDHPTPGSLGFDCLINSGEVCSFQIITYYDFNPDKNHGGSASHWNNGGRIIDRSGKAHLVRELKGILHIIKDYPWIKWTMIPGPQEKPDKIVIHRPKKT